MRDEFDSNYEYVFSDADWTGVYLDQSDGDYDYVCIKSDDKKWAVELRFEKGELIKELEGLLKTLKGETQ